MDANQIFGEASGLNPNPTDADLKESINKWIEEFRTNVLNDMNALITQTAGTQQESFWKETKETYTAELEELENEINDMT